MKFSSALWCRFGCESLGGRFRGVCWSNLAEIHSLNKINESAFENSYVFREGCFHSTDLTTPPFQTPAQRDERRREKERRRKKRGRKKRGRRETWSPVPPKFQFTTWKIENERKLRRREGEGRG